MNLNLLLLGLSLIFLSSVKVEAVLRVQTGCLIRHCFVPVMQCSLQNRPCQKMLQCLSRCDGTSELYDRCAIQCTLLHEQSSITRKFLRCLHENKCLREDSNSSPSTSVCPRPPARTNAEFDINRLSGKWWVAYGLSPIYDCWPCQTMSFRYNNSPVWIYDYEMVVGRPWSPANTKNPSQFITNNSLNQVLREIPCTVQQNTTGNTWQLTTKYLVSGIFPGTDDWHVLDYTDDGQFMLIYYCGKSDLSGQGEYQGAVIMARAQSSQSVPDSVLQRFDSTLVNNKLNTTVKKFCKNDNTNCPNAAHS